MLETLWEILPIAVGLGFSGHYLIKRPRLNYFKYILFALFPYISSNAGASGIYQNLTHLISIIVILVFGYDILIHHLHVSKIMLSYMIFIVYVLVSGLLIYADNNFYIGIRNMTLFSMTMFALYYGEGENLSEYQKIAKVNVVILVMTGITQFWISGGWRMLNLLYTNLRMGGITRNQNTYADFIIVYFFFACIGLDFKWKLPYALMTLVGIILSGSISGTIGWMLLMIGYGKQVMLIRKVYKWISIAIVGFMIVMVALRLSNPEYFNSLFTSQSDRMSLWALFLNAFKERPVFGHGWYTLYPRMSPFFYDMPKSKYTDYLGDLLTQKNAGVVAHNDIVKLLAETGILGTVLCLTFVYFCFRVCNKSKNIWFIKILTVGMVFMLTQNIVQNYEFWMIFFIPLLIESGKQEKNIYFK